MQAIKYVKTPHRMVIETHYGCIDVDKDTSSWVTLVDAVKENVCEVLSVLADVMWCLFGEVPINYVVDKVDSSGRIVIIFCLSESK